ncbi:SGNH/GDSL hydrolase family protein [Variovorax sp. RT4R15]|uniref:SGNH/GDSL hydrolase family protein n=1 Tax=Variovorax sp. RT4R15 TaxID=3443737 RepID=UPI003F477DCB
MKRTSLLVCVLLLWAAACVARADPVPPRWIASWAAAPLQHFPAASAAGAAPPPAMFPAQTTLRQRVFPTVGGDRVRVRFSNLFGTVPLRVAEASAAIGTGGPAVSPATLRPLYFGGRRAITIAPGTEAWSDAAPVAVRAGQAVAVSFYLDEATPFGTAHHLPLSASWAVPGNSVASAKLEGAVQPDWNHIVTGLDVAGAAQARVVVAFGDSITEGVNAFAPVRTRYPDRLAERLREPAKGSATVAVLNAGISGNRLLSDWIGPKGIDRFERDVLGQSGVTHAIILIGINDIGFGALNGPAGSPVPVGGPVSAEQITAGLQRLIDQARAKGVKVLLGTLMPIKGSGYWSADNEARRQAVNRWIRGRQQVGVVDFDAVMRDPRDPQALNPLYDSGDHLHPGDAGYAAMASAIDLQQLLE